MTRQFSIFLHRASFLFLLAMLGCTCTSGLASTNLSVWVLPDSRGRLPYQPDGLGNRLFDSSGAGYKSGLVPIPNAPVKVTISPVAGDNRANIQNAINQVQALSPDANGIRGAILLNAGVYPI